MHFIVQFVLILAVALLAGQLAARFKIPRIVGEIAAGILIGPTFLGSYAPPIDPWFFIAGKAALLIFMFAAGQKTRLRSSWAQAKRVLCVSLFGLTVPFLIAGVGARFTGLSWREAAAIGCAMNARGARSIVLATAALEHGVIGPALHADLVFVALATSLLAAPCLNFLRLVP